MVVALGPYCLQRLSADDTSRQRVKPVFTFLIHCLRSPCFPVFPVGKAQSVSCGLSPLGPPCWSLSAFP